MRRWPYRLGFATLLLCAFGCGAGGPSKYRVTGTVTFDGQPVDGGEIIFVPVDKGIAPDAGRIENGGYDLLVKAGKKRVEIRASRPVLGGKPNPMGPVYEDYIPAKYSAHSTLAADVKAEGANHFDYELKSGKK
jgi:hypothetical protein